MRTKRNPGKRGTNLLKERKKRIDKTYPMFNQYADDKSYKRYKHRQYRNLIIKSLLALVLGLLFEYLFL